MSGVYQFFYTPNRIIDSRGIAVGALLYFYLYNTTTLEPIYADPERTTPLANPYTVNAGAAIPNIYLDPLISYRVRIVAVTGEVLYDGAPWQAVPQDMNVIYPFNDAYDTEVDSSDTLNSLLQNRTIPSVVTPIVYPYRDNGLGSSWACMRIGEAVSIPADRHLVGMGDTTNFRPLSTLTGGMFYCNTDGTSPIVATPIGLSSRIENLFFVNRDENADPVDGVPVFKFSGQQRFSEIYSLGFTTLIEQTTGGNSYSDEVRIERMRSLSQPDTGDDGTRRALIRLVSNGDAFEVDQVSNDVPEDATGDGRHMRGYTLLVVARTAGEIKNIINGDVKVSFCSSITVTNLHMEYGFFYSLSSSGAFTRMEFYMRGDQTDGIDDPVVGVPFNISKASDTVKICDAIVCSDISFLYLAGWTHPWGTQKNFTIDYPQHVDFERIYRKYSTTDATISTILGALQHQTADQASNSDTSYLDFNNYSHIASAKSTWSWGSSGKGLWLINAAYDALEWAAGISNSGTVTALITIPGSLDNVRWGAATGTVYYKAAGYYDIVRGLGVIGSVEVNFAVTNGQKPIPSIGIGSETRGHPVMVRLYRGTSTGSYDKYVDIPMLSGGILVDNGVDVCGFPWITRVAGAPDAVNDVGVMKSYRLHPGVFSTASDAYGNVEIYTDNNIVPTVGGWRRGDLVKFRIPMGENAEVKLGWQRITDCTSAATANALYTDWMPIMVSSPHGSRTTAQLEAIANTVNTKWKSAGLRVFNSTTVKWCTAQGPAAGDTWIEDGTGTVYTPV